MFKNILDLTNLTKCTPQVANTYFLDIDGTIVDALTIDDLIKYKFDKRFIQELLPGVKKFFDNLNANDVIIFTTARSEQFRQMTLRTLNYHNIRFKHLIMDLPSGKRYLINDTPNVLFKKAIGISVLRNYGFGDPTNFDPDS